MIDSKSNTSLAEFQLNEMKIDFQLLKDAFKCFIKVGELELYDKINKEKIYQKLFTSKKDKIDTKNNELLSIFIEKNPSDQKSDFFFGITLNRVEIVFNIKMIQRICKNFFKKIISLYLYYFI
jgi:hypothetical protein